MASRPLAGCLVGDDTGLLKRTRQTPAGVVCVRGTQAPHAGVSRVCWGPGADETHRERWAGAALESGAVQFWRLPAELGRSTGGPADDSSSQPTPPPARVFLPSTDAERSADAGLHSAFWGAARQAPCGVVGLGVIGGGGSESVISSDRTATVRVWKWDHPSARGGGGGGAEPSAEFKVARSALCAVVDGDSRVCLGGRNVEAKLIDLNTQQKIFEGESTEKHPAHTHTGTSAVVTRYPSYYVVPLLPLLHTPLPPLPCLFPFPRS